MNPPPLQPQRNHDTTSSSSTSSSCSAQKFRRRKGQRPNNDQEEEAETTATPSTSTETNNNNKNHYDYIHSASTLSSKSCGFYLVLLALLQVTTYVYWQMIIDNGKKSTSSRSVREGEQVRMLGNYYYQRDNSVVTCTTNNNNKEQDDYDECCGTWNVNADDWWLHNPDWHVSLENDTHFCFTPLSNETQRSFIRHIHDMQWNIVDGEYNCSEVQKTVELNSGFGTCLNWLMHTVWYAYKRKKTFQIINGNRKWLYATTNQSSWAYCDSEDSRCYYLPVSPCSRNETIRGEHHDDRPRNKYEEHIFHWLKQYIARPRQAFRRQLYQLQSSIPMKYPCIAMHVRRSDAGVPTTPFRRYAAVQEYIDALGKDIQPGDTILLMTDDESTIDELYRYSSLLADRYHWIYLNKTRNRGLVGGFDGHIPTGDEGLEMVAIHTEHRLASTCDRFVYGLSGFMSSLMFSLDMEGTHAYTKYFVNTEVSKEEARKWKADQNGRVRMFMEDIEQFYQKRLSATTTSTTSS